MILFFDAMKILRLILFFLMVSIWNSSELSAQVGKQSSAKAGYVYPAGGQRGTTFEVWVVGRNLLRTVDAAFSGNGISAKVVDTMYAFRNLDQRDRYNIRNRIGEVAARHIKFDNGVFMKTLIEKLPKVSKPPDPPEEIEAVPFVWPRHVMLRKIAEPDVFVLFDEICEIIYFTYGPGMWRRPPDILMDVVILEVTITPDAEPGNRELRLVTMSGLSTPLYFQVGVHPEVKEREPNSMETNGIAGFMRERPAPIYETPVVVNGQILHSDTDRFQFRAKKDEQLVLHAQARQLMPYLADAVPGWFEAVLTVYDANEKELAYADCYRFDADPLLKFTPPEDGVYTVEIRDSVFRGREDFVYRLAIAPLPVIESVFPLGLKQDTSVTLKLECNGNKNSNNNNDSNNNNLEVREVQVNAISEAGRFHELSQIGSQWLPLPIRYEVDTLPETFEAGNNNSVAAAQPVAMPIVINGKISKPGEYDFYRFAGNEGATVTIEVTARRLNSLLDSRIALFDAAGKLLAENDDGKTVDEKYKSQIFGTQTHNADSKISLVLPQGSPFVLRIGDALRNGGNAYGYRLRISKPRPEFDVYTTPSALTFFAGNCEPIWFYVDRSEEENTPIELRIAGDAQGFQLDGGLIQAGEKSVVATLTTPKEPRNKAIKLQFEAVAVSNGQTGQKIGQEIRRPVYAVDDMEQAFLYHHHVPASNFWVLMQNSRNGTGFRPIKPDKPEQNKTEQVKTETDKPEQVKTEPIKSEPFGLEPLQLKPGQSIDVTFESETGSIPPTTFFYLKEAPAGIWVKKKLQEKKKLVLTFGANSDTLQKAEKPFLAGNLIVAVDAESNDQKKNRYQTGTLPAIPYRLEP
ncbi:MAG: PPC domain-containing protein [Planctomycetaceae bacterium]|nr:PPC domain-containing protein [Planctomycetaceae bacterium]